MHNKTKLPKIIKKAGGYNIRPENGGTFCIYAGKNLVKSNYPSVEKAAIDAERLSGNFDKKHNKKDVQRIEAIKNAYEAQKHRN